MSITKIKTPKNEKDSSVKISPELYKESVDISKANPADFPSVNNFIEIAVRRYIDSIRYNIENKQPISKEGKAITSNKEFTKCILCDKVFLADKSEEGEKKRICPRCKEVILYFAEKLEK